MPILKNIIYIQRFPFSALLLAQVCNINRVWSAKNFSFLCQIIYFSDEIDELEWRSVILSDQTPMLRDNSGSGRPFFDGSRGNWEKASFWPIWKHLPDPLALAFLPPLVQKKKRIKKWLLPWVSDWVYTRMGCFCMPQFPRVASERPLAWQKTGHWFLPGSWPLSLELVWSRRDISHRANFSFSAGSQPECPA